MFRSIGNLLHSHGGMGLNGLMLIMVGGAGVSLRELPHRCWEALTRLVTMTVTVKDEDAAFAWVKQWLLEQPFQRRLRRVDLDTSVRENAVAMMLAPGSHWFMHGGRPFCVYFERGEPRAGRSMRRAESMTFTTLGRKRETLESFIREIEQAHHRADQATSRLYIYDDYWCEVKAYAPRSIDAVILPADEKERLLRDIARFRSARAQYRDLGVPYHRGYLLHGPPGTGKTSLVGALASSFGMSLYALNLAEMEDRSLKAAMNEVPENSVVLLEDIDCMQLHRRALAREDAGRETGERGVAVAGKSRVTLSGLLNVMDGFHAPENVLFVLTTNDVGALDPALLRPGRVDYEMHMGLATHEQRIGLYLRFFPQAAPGDAHLFAQQHEGCTMAVFQGELLRYGEATVTQLPEESAPARVKAMPELVAGEEGGPMEHIEEFVI